MAANTVGQGYGRSFFTSPRFKKGGTGGISYGRIYIRSDASSGLTSPESLIFFTWFCSTPDVLQRSS